MRKVGVILSGCGFLDGAEIREAVLSLLAIDQADAMSLIYAPNRDQHHVVDHLGQQETAEKRNCLAEAARIARGEIADLKDANPDELDALVIPGGFGVAKNLSDFAFKGPEGKLLPEFEALISSMHSAKKPIGVICISPAVIQLLLGKNNAEVTIGDDAATASAIEKLGGKHFTCSANEVHVDEANKLVSTPAYMYGAARMKDIYAGINECVQKTLSLI